MRFLGSALALLLLAPLGAVAAPAFFYTPVSEDPYAPVMLGNEPELEKEYYGNLGGNPIMYSVASDKPFTLHAQLSLPSFLTLEPLSLLILRVNPEDESLAMVARVNTAPETWVKERDSILGMSFHRGEVYSEALPAGTYQIEVSSPDNRGMYQLRLGTEVQTVGYWGTWKRVLAVNNFFDRGVIAWVTSLFLLPHAIAAILLALFIYRRYRRP